MADDPIRNEDGSIAGAFYRTGKGTGWIRGLVAGVKPSPEQRWLEMDCAKLCDDVQRYFDARYEAGE